MLHYRDGSSPSRPHEVLGGTRWARNGPGRWVRPIGMGTGKSGVMWSRADQANRSERSASLLQTGSSNRQAPLGSLT